ncbi:hypothetical protein [Bacillus sp. MRMR6]|uniref:hypothetical protein n=1 Tax=Bacillus sp. MRMR6 TaxID=1928617 RepID=UPI0009515DA6|nr:hypothetical protein [Bacillus sp. MRMR6]OLS39150.1 hypothetical protein BTR25_13545 [Bacillus sp. MRMR6]
MKIVLYKDAQVISIVDEVYNPIVNGNNITWDDGSLTGIKTEFLLLDDLIIVSGEVTPEIIAQDKKLLFGKKDEVAGLKAQLQEAKEANEMNAMAIMELAEMLLGGGE